MDVSTSTLAAAVQGVRALISAYEGYEKGRFMESDEAVRAEIQRRCEMLGRHAEKLQADVHAAGNRTGRAGLESMIESINILRNEAQFSITSNHVSQHKGIGKLKAKAVRKLVNHDSEVLQALVDTTRMANALADEMSDLDDGTVNARISEWHQKLTRTRNMYLERNMYIDGLTKR
ncbi:MAG TPA: hypothetical protein D7I11_06140 [Candidatus Poseidoniales archaeon]|nr:MAG TPA: hypothetical protein D7I11_06140 [Candidatus Poseidoniales archaeon]|tara:strand:- start:1391 stop:1918 length:528 start_codon:yes stop_codon:yes gene_type:complete